MEALNTQLLQFFDKLLWISIQSSVLIILIVLVQIILRRRLPIRWHYLIWLLLLIRLAMPWLPESKISIFNLVPRSIQQGRLIESISEPQNARGMGFYLYTESTDVQEVQPEGDSKAVFVKFVSVLPSIWLFGTVIMVCYVCMRNISLWLTVKRERPITDQKILDLLEDCKMEAGVQTILGVVVNDKIKSPALFGFVRPRLLLPQGMLETYGLDELRYVFIHELAHLKQRDIYFGWLMTLLQIAHWFNPLMWFAFGRIRADRELACDGLAISMMGADEPPKYGQTIVNVLENFSQVQYVPSVAGILEDKSQIERRIQMIAKFKKVSHPRWAGAMLLLAVLACIILTNAYVAKADFTFSIPTNLGPVINSSSGEWDPKISADGLSFYFGSDRPGGYGLGDLWVATRATTNDDWSEPVNLGPTFNTSSDDNGPSISTDGLELYFSSNHPRGFGDYDLYVSTRATKDAPWGEPSNLGSVFNDELATAYPDITTDGLSLYFTSGPPGRVGDYDLCVSTRATKDDPWGEPSNLGSVVNNSSVDATSSISSDGLVLFFCSDRPGGYGVYDLWVTTRPTTNDDWGEPVNLGPEINTSGTQASPIISSDSSTLYFQSDRPGGIGQGEGLDAYDIWQVRILPVVDFNGDGIVDSIDVGMMVDHWLTNEPLYDIAPMPSSDGIVDVKDLILLTEHLTVTVDDPNEPNLP
jgi:beta-lactamase regulating signal transducer with metallopeptidase domain